MATRTIPAVTLVTDDITGKDLADQDKPVKVTVTVKSGNGKAETYTLDMADAAHGKLTAFLANPTDETRKAFGDIVPRNTVGKSGTSKPGNSDTATARAWLASMTEDQRKAIPGYSPDQVKAGARGKLPDETMDAWRKVSQDSGQASGQGDQDSGQADQGSQAA